MKSNIVRAAKGDRLYLGHDRLWPRDSSSIEVFPWHLSRTADKRGRWITYRDFLDDPKPGKVWPLQ
jgi:hypothetical protein